jgi:hypothetical protein
MTTHWPSVYLNAARSAMRLAVECRRTRNAYDTAWRLKMDAAYNRHKNRARWYWQRRASFLHEEDRSNQEFAE